MNEEEIRGVRESKREQGKQQSHPREWRAWQRRQRLYVVHLARRLLVLVEAGDRGQVVVVFALGAGVVGGVLVGVLLDVLWGRVSKSSSR